ncbi:MAG: UDP-N-acetylglucosamine 2-epimerase [marine benthic group bacterium]|nr:UDP-N-acetylglucosamine 2-epimerase [Candidatus Benthicola marisminoris]
MNVLHVIGSRSGFFRISPVYRALRAAGAEEQVIVYAGRRSDYAPEESFLSELDLPRPDHVLGMGGGSSALLTGRSLIALEPIVSRARPDWIFAVGDVDAALAAAIVGRKNGIATAHLEAGLRTGDSSAPEEVNRLLTDRLSDTLFTAGPEAETNLLEEGISGDRIHVVGNVVADSLLRLRERASHLNLPSVMGLERGSFLLALLRQRRNVVEAERLERILSALDSVALATGRATILVMEPEVAENVHRHQLDGLLAPLTVVESTTYAELLGLVQDAAAVVTDASEIQDSTTLLGVPCIALDHSIVRRITVRQGTNFALNLESDDLVDAIMGRIEAAHRPNRPALWDGNAARRIAEITLQGLTSEAA